MLKSMEQALGTSKPFSSVSVWIDRLSANSYGEDDFEGIPELVEAINIQATGPAEASRALRKKLKYGSVHGQKRAITMLAACVENCGPRFQTTFADERLVQQIKLMSQDPLVDASVRRKLMRMLLNWNRQFKNESTMRLPAGLYAACGGGRKSEAQLKSEAAEAFKKQREREDRERQVRADRKAAERLQKEEDKKRAKAKPTGAKRAPFDFQKEKPQVQMSLATSQQAATALVNALQHVNREKESVTDNERVQTYLARVKAERKKLVRYIQLVRDEEWLGSLISANDQVILALQLYDKLAKPIGADSDDEDNESLAAIQSRSQAERQQARIEADDAEIEIVQKRLAAARLDYPDGELEKLQDRQRRGIERHNSYVSSMRSGREGHGGAMGDLMDLNFEDDAGAAGGPSRAGAGPSQGGQHHSLSDYSDYDSEEEEVAGAGLGGSGATGVDRWGAYAEGSRVGADQDDNDDAWSTHRPEIGTHSLLNDEDDDDPFGDSHAFGGNDDEGLGQSPELHRGPRKEFAAI